VGWDWDGRRVWCAGGADRDIAGDEFYARYYIHEMPLVFFIYLASPARGDIAEWEKAVGVSLWNCAGAAYATKETWVLSLAAMGLGIGLALLWTKMVDLRVPEIRPLLRGRFYLGRPWWGWWWRDFVFGIVHEYAGAVGCDQDVFDLSSSQHWGGSGGMHDKEFGYYLRLLLYWRYGRGPIHSEAFIVFLAIVGLARSLWPSFWGGVGRPVFLRFLAFIRSL